MVLNFQKDISLRPFNTFGIDIKSKKFVGIQSTDELKSGYKTTSRSATFGIGGRE
jgi:UDP-N-acetylmuramate dehydrogenase